MPVGLLSTALLVVNNLRDIEGDALVGKRTLAVLLGARGTRLAYVGLLAGAFAVIAGVGISTPGPDRAARRPSRGPTARTVLTGGRGPALIGALQGTGLLTLITGILLATGLALSA